MMKGQIVNGKGWWPAEIRSVYKVISLKTRGEMTSLKRLDTSRKDIWSLTGKSSTILVRISAERPSILSMSGEIVEDCTAESTSTVIIDIVQIGSAASRKPSNMYYSLVQQSVVVRRNVGRETEEVVVVVYVRTYYLASPARRFLIRLNEIFSESGHQWQIKPPSGAADSSQFPLYLLPYGWRLSFPHLGAQHTRYPFNARSEPTESRPATVGDAHDTRLHHPR